DERLTKSPPREIVFLCDVSGSMSGAPTQKVIQAMQHMLKLCRAQDTVQVITFANMAQKLFERPVPVQEESIKRALNFTQGLQGGGGTEMLNGVRMAIDEPLDKERVRIVVMLTDGYIGNEAQIIEHVGKHCGDQVRFWAIGIGSSPNMFLIDGVAKQGGGMGKKLGLEDDSATLTQEVMTRIQRAQLSNVKIAWGPHHIAETYPAKIPELWAGRPVIVFGRYTGGGAGRIAISGNVEGQDVSWPLDVQLPADDPQHDVLAKVWARQKIETLMQSSYYQGSPAVEEEVTSLALDYQLMSQYTSFVAVDAQDAGKLEPSARPPRRMLVPVPLPEGTRWEGFFGPAGAERDEDLIEQLATPYKSKSESRLSLGKEAPSGGFRYALPSSGPAPSRPAAAAPLAEALKRSQPAFSGTPMSRRQAAPQRSVGGVIRGRTLGGSALSGLAGGPPAPAESAVHRLAFSADGASLATSAGDRSVTLWGAAFGAWGADVDTLSKDAQQAFQQGQQAWKDGKLSDARSTLTKAYLFDTAAMNASASDENLAALALGRLEQVHRQEITTWAKEVPALDKRLDLVVRDRSVAEALATVAQATGLTVKLIPGSVEDAAALQGGESPRVSFLDLRGATAAQAFDWILQPVRLAWWTDKGDIVAGSQRRREGVSAWVYDVSTIAWPTAAEIGKVPDRQPPRDTARKATDEFLAVVRSQLKTSGQQVVVWFAPGQLVVIGDADLQTKAGQLFADLADARFQPQGQLAKLHAVTSVRAKERLGEVEQQRAARRLQEVMAAHRQYGWRLLAAASDGKSDPEAVTELQLAWNRVETDRLLAEAGAGLALRSLWLIRESARALPDDAELQQLAAVAWGKSRSAVDAAVLALKKNPEDMNAFASVLYATLAAPDDGRLRGSASTLLTGAAPKGSPLAAARTVAGALLQESSKIDRTALAQLVSAGVSGEDLVVLTALACRRAGGDTWQKFRAESRDVLANNALSGDVIVLISRLTNAPLPMLAAK
ncbi:MAG: VWA domain-containing protein, partial [Planctomycetota bacterium]|nr:VWA domain-containing protein [Planctomycetota bacterium]